MRFAVITTSSRSEAAATDEIRTDRPTRPATDLRIEFSIVRPRTTQAVIESLPCEGRSPDSWERTGADTGSFAGLLPGARPQWMPRWNPRFRRSLPANKSHLPLRGQCRHGEIAHRLPVSTSVGTEVTFDAGRLRTAHRTSTRRRAAPRNSRPLTWRPRASQPGYSSSASCKRCASGSSEKRCISMVKAHEKRVAFHTRDSARAEYSSSRP